MAQHNLDDPSIKNGGLNKTVRQFNSCVKGVPVCILWHKAMFPL